MISEVGRRKKGGMSESVLFVSIQKSLSRTSPGPHDYTLKDFSGHAMFANSTVVILGLVGTSDEEKEQ